MSTRKPSLKDIAKAAGVSPALVSFVMTGKDKYYRVNQETADKIRNIAEELNYRPNIIARYLREGRTNSIGFIVSDISNPFYAQAVRALEDVAMNEGYTVFSVSTDEDPNKMNHLISNLLTKGVDGILLVPCPKTGPNVEALIKKNIPLVLFDRYFDDFDCNYVALDNFHASYNLTIKLIEKGFTMPYLFAYDVEQVHMQQRIEGYKKAMKDKKMEDHIHVELVKLKSSAKQLKKIIPTCVNQGARGFIFATHNIALNSLSVLKSLEGDMLREVGIASFDKSPVFDFLPTQVVYLQQPIETMVQEALRILNNAIKNEGGYEKILAKGRMSYTHPDK